MLEVMDGKSMTVRSLTCSSCIEFPPQLTELEVKALAKAAGTVDPCRRGNVTVRCFHEQQPHAACVACVWYLPAWPLRLQMRTVRGCRWLVARMQGSAPRDHGSAGWPVRELQRSAEKASRLSPRLPLTRALTPLATIGAMIAAACGHDRRGSG